MEQIRDAPFLIKTLIAEIVESGGRTMFTRVHYVIYLTSMIVYVLSPFDLIPEAIFGVIGLIDDAIVVGTLLMGASSVFYRGLVERNIVNEHQD